VDAGGLGIRTSIEGDRFGTSRHAVELAPGRLVVADSNCVHAMLFGEIAPGHRVGQRTSHAALFAVGVDGVPTIHVEEALWVCVEALSTS
jgi:hypothetical protein